jgi:hypothetical protein
MREEICTRDPPHVSLLHVSIAHEVHRIMYPFCMYRLHTRSTALHADVSCSQVKVTVHLTLARLQLRAWLFRHGIAEPWLVACGLLVADHGADAKLLPDAPKLIWPAAVAPLVQNMEKFLEEVIGRPQILYISSSQREGSWVELLWLEWEVAAAAGLSALLLVLTVLRCCCNRAT